MSRKIDLATGVKIGIDDRGRLPLRQRVRRFENTSAIRLFRLELYDDFDIKDAFLMIYWRAICRRRRLRGRQPRRSADTANSRNR